MRPIRWHKPKWLPRLLALPVPEPAQQAGQILSIQRNIVLPVKLIFTAIVFYYLFDSHWIEAAIPGTSEVILEFLRVFFICYIIANALATALLVLKRFPHRLVPWIVFCVGLLDGLLLAGLTVETGGFSSNLFWVFPGLIIINALSIPLATPQIVLNLCLCAFYLCAGVLNTSLGESETTLWSIGVLPQRLGTSKFTANDIVDLSSLSADLKSRDPRKPLPGYLRQQLSPITLELLTNYSGGTNFPLQQQIADDLNRIIQKQSIYDPARFSGVNISPETSNLLSSHRPVTNWARLNRSLLLDAFPGDFSRGRRNNPGEPVSASNSSAEIPLPPDYGAESFILRLIILLLLTSSCYGVQLLSFRQRVSDEEARKSAARNDELRAAGRLAAEIAHQLKNPLGIINNAAFSLARGLKDGKNDLDLQLEIIREEIERSDRIITQLMGYAQLSEGRVEKIDPAEELDRAITEVFPPGNVQGIEIIRQYGQALPGLLMQRTHLSVVLVNILQNAREALGERGSITLSAHAPDENSIEMVIADNGPGIPHDKLDKIFEAYYTSKEKGTGLGLAIVKHNVELYGGTIWAESELGKGARFVLTFPAKTLIAAAR